MLWLQIDELNAMAKEHEKAPIKIPNGELKKCTSEDQELLCQHKGSGMPYFALGLCEACYREVSNFFRMHDFCLLLNYLLLPFIVLLIITV